MPQDRIARRMKFAQVATQIVIGAAFAALVICANAPAARAGDGDDDVSAKESFSDKFMRTLGIKNPGSTEYEINYSERSPLVVPPSRNLPRVSQDPRTVPAPGTSEQSEPVNRPKKSIFSFDFLQKEQYATFTGEPPRSSLTDPPPGYQTPSPDQPYGLAPEHKPYVPKTLGERLEPTR
jgi:hypothetical protein